MPDPATARRSLFLFALVALALVTTACTPRSAAEPPTPVADSAPVPYVAGFIPDSLLLRLTTSQGAIDVLLRAEWAPNGVQRAMRRRVRGREPTVGALGPVQTEQREPDARVAAAQGVHAMYRFDQGRPGRDGHIEEAIIPECPPGSGEQQDVAGCAVAPAAHVRPVAGLVVPRPPDAAADGLSEFDKLFQPGSDASR